MAIQNHFLFCGLAAMAGVTVYGQVSLDRTSLPIHEPRVLPITRFYARDAKAPPRSRFRRTAASGRSGARRETSFIAGRKSG